MKTNPCFAAVVLSTAFLASGAVAQTSDQTPPPAATATVSSPTPAPNTIIYIPQLPNPTELANAAAAQGLVIEKIVQTSAQIIVVYKYANGQINTVAYQLLPVAGTAPATTTTVVYASPAPAYYYEPYPYYDPWPWFAPVAFSVGIGYHGGWGSHGGWGHHGGYGFRHH